MKRTTLNLDDDLLRRLKQKADREDRTLESVVNELLRQGLAAPSGSRYRLDLLTWKGELQVGVDLFDRDALLEMFDAAEAELTEEERADRDLLLGAFEPEDE